MKKSVILLLLAFLGLECYSQLVHYGYPTEREALPKKSVVVLNIPHHQMTGGYYFINEEQIDSLVAFLVINDTNRLRIEINCFYGPAANEYASKKLCIRLKEILEKKTSLKNYYIVSKGDSNPVYCSEVKDSYYFARNTRMEIFVE
ncbi:MAG: hypothetical protein J5701_06160 [Bacteroidales bacterium]|nr:hypothetical protein [Bacteroidales bacterium]